MIGAGMILVTVTSITCITGVATITTIITVATIVLTTVIVTHRHVGGCKQRHQMFTLRRKSFLDLICVPHKTQIVVLLALGVAR
jgi:hypothetical protein